jgi:4-hydroxy-3-polyprenylbenzoate decarboxylase
MSDFRKFISHLDNAGELKRIRDEVDWKYEVGEKTREALKGSSNKALLFENIKDYPEYMVFTNGLGTYRRVSMALGLEPRTPFRETVKVLKHRMSHPTEPVLIDDGPCRENIIAGDDVDLTKLPVPWWSRKDDGRYIGTWHINITKDSETGTRNVGIYRMQLKGPRKALINASPKSHLTHHLHKEEKKGVPLDMAVAIGISEPIIIAGGAAVPYGVDEFHIAGSLCQEPVTLIKCNTIDIEVPAASEIVIEGKVLPGKREKEGPFLDYSGVPSFNRYGYVFEVTGLMYRNNPIFRGAAIGEPGAEDHLLYRLIASSGYLDFHGSRLRQKAQNILLKKSNYRLFQASGTIKKRLS